MRLVRLAQQPSRVAEDVRAALASLGRGSTVIGGVALIGADPVGEGAPVEAVVVLPKGVLIVIGVDLPDPALRLEAPLSAQWKADGWPLVHGDDTVNPATEALDVSQACERRIAEIAPGAAPIGTILAVGPYVETVEQPPADLAGPVRVLYPTPTSMLAATVSLATARRPRSIDQARALIEALAPGTPDLSDEVLLGEGFSQFSDNEQTVIRENPLVAAAPTRPVPPQEPPAKPAPAPVPAAVPSPPAASAAAPVASAAPAAPAVKQAEQTPAKTPPPRRTPAPPVAQRPPTPPSAVSDPDPPPPPPPPPAPPPAPPPPRQGARGVHGERTAAPARPAAFGVRPAGEEVPHRPLAADRRDRTAGRAARRGDRGGGEQFLRHARAHREPEHTRGHAAADAGVQRPAEHGPGAEPGVHPACEQCGPALRVARLR
ncbi:hypothetical protein ACFWY9_06460 [Amycolatopsis sp. NPDC059027]|uniref:hypothetical protein n=1 Tax=Amycolatopsis sp. NPDC059027 TaxID=3346709 RepID=UPI00366ABE55